MKVKSILIDEINIGERRREDYGDIDGLAESIGKYGLFHPITIDGKKNLVAGERRLRACKQLGWLEIPTRSYSDLTPDERREIELEENIRRKDLTQLERSKITVALVETAAEILKSDFQADSAKKSGKGRPQKPDAEAKVAERIGIPQRTLNDAKQHVAAVTRYPELAVVAPTQKDAITVAKNLDKMPEADRAQARSRLLKHDQPTLAVLAEKPPMPAPTRKADKTPGYKWREWLNTIRMGLSGIHNTGTNNLTREWSEVERRSFISDLSELRANLDGLITELQEQEHELRQQVG